jgi:hypothetical protein
MKTIMTPISEKAFAVMAICPETHKSYGISVDYEATKRYKFVWAFQIDAAKAHREGYDVQSVHGSIDIDTEFPGCPYCHAKQFVFCSCGAVICWHGQRVVTCPKCGASGEVTSAEEITLKGGGY